MDAQYMKLVTSFPLLPITNKAGHAAARQMILKLTERDGELTPAEAGYGKILVQLVQSYERQLVADFFEPVSGEAALEHLLNEHRMTKTDAAKIAGISKQNLNDFLKRRRGLPRGARIRLAEHFKVSPDVFERLQAVTSA
jgi:antitoxin component HigA of HigAB toxin-antitoxin module